MTEGSAYTKNEANHYQSYRPPLHHELLEHCLKSKHFETALDVGCGVGTSTIALTNYCKQVNGYDPSVEMIQKASEHSAIKYYSDLNRLDNHYNLIVFFGSLFYVNTKQLAFFTQKQRQNDVLLCCDFKVNYSTILKALGISVGPYKYDHAKNLSSYGDTLYDLLRSERLETCFTCDRNEVAHLLLSEDAIKYTLGLVNKVDGLIQQLSDVFEDPKFTLEATLFYSIYERVS
jgi:SAM-dependent methyltransferase